MICPAANLREKEQLLGEIQTEIALTGYHQAHFHAGEAIKLRRELNNNHALTAIRVENERSVGVWLRTPADRRLALAPHRRGQDSHRGLHSNRV